MIAADASPEATKARPAAAIAAMIDQLRRFAPDPSSGPSGHLLPQGEKEKRGVTDSTRLQSALGVKSLSIGFLLGMRDYKDIRHRNPR
jgi:hypothetical protein